MSNKFKINIQLFAPQPVRYHYVPVMLNSEVIGYFDVETKLIVEENKITVSGNGNFYPVSSIPIGKSYEYAGSKYFKGVSLSSDASTLDYDIGDEINISDSLELYIVEANTKYDETLTVEITATTENSISFTTTGNGTVSVGQASSNVVTSPMSALPNETYILYPINVKSEGVYTYGDPVTVKTPLPTVIAEGGAVIDVKVKNKNGVFIEFGNGEITAISSTSQSTPDTSGINYGTIANTGSMTVFDDDGSISEQIEQGTIDSSNLDIELYFNGNKIQEHISNDSDYDTANMELNIPLTNDMQELDTRIYDGFVYPDGPKTLLFILKDVMQKLMGNDYTDAKFSAMLQETTLTPLNSEISLYDYCDAITVEYPSIKYGRTYRDVLNEICTIAQMQMYKDDDNSYKFISARPIATYRDVAYYIPDSSLFEPLSYTKILKNKYDGVEVNKINTSVDLDINSLIQTYYSYNSTTKTVSHNSNYTPAESYSVGFDAYVYVTYYSDTISISKKSEDNFVTIEKIISGVDANNNANIRHVVHYKYYESTSITMSQVFVDSQPPVHITWNDGVDTTGEIATYNTFTASISGVSASVNDETNLKITSVREDADNWYIDYKIAVGVEYIKDAYMNNTVMSSSNAQKAVPISLDVSIYGNKQTITFNQVSDRTDGYDNANNKVTIQGGDLLQTGTKFREPILQTETEVSSIIKNNILNDYARGIASGKTLIGAGNFTFDKSDEEITYYVYALENTLGYTFIEKDGDYYVFEDIGSGTEYRFTLEQIISELGITIPEDKIYSQGKLLKTGDIIRVGDDGRYWKITTREFRDDGEVMLPIQFIDVSNTYHK